MNIFDRITAIGTKMTEMDASIYQGAFIGKISYNCDKEKAAAAETISYEFGEVKENAFMYILTINGVVAGEDAPIEKFTVTLVKPSDKEKELKRMEAGEYDEPREFAAFTKQEVYDFSAETGDENKIHLTDHPVVQGMLLLRTTAVKLDDVSRLDFKFVEPSYAEEKLMWALKGRDYVLYADGFVKATIRAM